MNQNLPSEACMQIAFVCRTVFSERRSGVREANRLVAHRRGCGRRAKQLDLFKLTCFSCWRSGAVERSWGRIPVAAASSPPSPAAVALTGGPRRSRLRSFVSVDRP